MLLVLGVVVFRASRLRAQNGLLALALVLEASNWAWIAVVYSTDDPTTAYAARIANVAAFLGMFFVYLAFLGTLNTPVSRPLGTAVGRGIVGVAALAGLSFLVARPTVFYPEVIPGPFSVWEVSFARGPVVILVAFTYAVLLFGLLVALLLVRATTPGTPGRARAKVFLAAFGLRDVLFIAGFAPFLSGFQERADPLFLLGFALQWLGAGLFSALLAYGFLRHQLLDIDLRIKWTISRGTLAAVFLAVFFVVATIASEFLTGTLGYAVGGVAAGLLLFALAPLQRVAERVADRAMPRVQDTDEYRLVRKREVYRAAVESALHDGVVTDRERDMLATLQEKLDIAPTEAVRIEREAAEGSA